jgi:hypothetical protein
MGLISYMYNAGLEEKFAHWGDYAYLQKDENIML